MNELLEYRPVHRKMVLQTVTKRGAWILLGVLSGILLLFFLCLFLGFPGVPLAPTK